jgi:hypothetical protein
MHFYLPPLLPHNMRSHSPKMAQFITARRVEGTSKYDPVYKDQSRALLRLYDTREQRRSLRKTAVRSRWTRYHPKTTDNHLSWIVGGSLFLQNFQSGFFQVVPLGPGIHVHL